MEFAPHHLLFVAAGGAVGGLARFWLSTLVGRLAGETFPWGTLAVNVSGSFLIGLAAAVLAPPDQGVTLSVWLLLAIGTLGSYTTVSSFSLQTLSLIQDRRWGAAACNAGLSLLLCLSAVASGFVAGAALWGGGA